MLATRAALARIALASKVAVVDKILGFQGCKRNVEDIKLSGAK